MGNNWIHTYNKSVVSNMGTGHCSIFSEVDVISNPLYMHTGNIEMNDKVIRQCIGIIDQKIRRGRGEGRWMRIKD